jgi:hypothetical protein
MELQLSAGQAVVVALVLTAALVALHLAAPHIRRLPLVPEAATGSFAGGLAVAYVFLHLLPELAEGNEAIGDLLHHVLRPTPLVDLGIFVVALIGFVAFFALQRIADRAGASRPTGARAVRRPDGAGGGVRGRPAGTDPPGPKGPVGVYRLHLGSFMVYNALITYTMPLRVRTGMLFALMFTLAMGLHFVLTDRELNDRYPTRLGNHGRLLLAGALVLGWAVAALVAPTSAVLVAVLTALLAGSILLNVFKEEIPSGTTSSFGWFLTGLTMYAALLAVVTAVSE